MSFFTDYNINKMEWEDDYDDRYDYEEEDFYEDDVRRPSRKTNSHRDHRTHRDRNHREEYGNRREGSRREGNHREGNHREYDDAPYQREDGYEDEFGDYNDVDTGYDEPSSLAIAVTSSSQVEQEASQEEEELFQLGDGLPALPPKMRSPLRQGEESIQAQAVEPTTEPEFSMPPGSDLGAVGKIGIYQMAQRNAASSNNIVFWVYILTLLMTYVLARR